MSAGKSGSTFERTYFSLFIINNLKFQITKKHFRKKDSQEDSAQFYQFNLLNHGGF